MAIRKVVDTEDQAKVRAHLIELCERAIVAEQFWTNRDSMGAQIQIGKLWALLKAGCEFTVEPETKHDCYWVDIRGEGFNYHESFDPRYDLEEDFLQVEHGYIPTDEKLRKADGKDWY